MKNKGNKKKLDVGLADSNIEKSNISEDEMKKGQATAFVIMPFSEKGVEPRPSGFFTEVFSQIIQPAAEAAGYNAETGDIPSIDVIHHTILSQLVQADLVVADLTDHNPNVLFELGIRIAVNKPVALIKAEGTPKVFDLEAIRVYQYDSRLWPSTIPQDIEAMTERLTSAKSRSDADSFFNLLTGAGAVKGND